MMSPAPAPKPRSGLSIVIPVYNEEDNLERLHARVLEGVSPVQMPVEIVYVDDGSRDGSPAILAKLARSGPRVRVVRFRRNYGQTAAMTAGIDHSTGEIVVTLDADLQNDPMDIPKLLAKMEEGYDVVSGWRRDRQDDLTRTLPSRAANWLIAKVTGLPLHDFGCTLKAYRRSIFDEVRLYGEMHRFVPAYAHWAGANVAELEVRHNPRTAGASKYGLSRTIKVVLDLLTLTFLHSYSTKPLYVFGGAGALCALLSMLLAAFVVWRRIFWHGDWMSPLILVIAVLAIGAVQFTLMGLLAEILVRTYHESQGKPTYSVGEVIEQGPPPAERTA